MSFIDQTLTCRDCNQNFTFTAGEQEFFASRGLTNTPTRCPSCRAERKSRMSDRSGGRRGGYRDSREERAMYTATCASCGNEALVPFQPREDRPVYCSDCYQPRTASRGGDRRSRW